MQGKRTEEGVFHYDPHRPHPIFKMVPKSWFLTKKPTPNDVEEHVKVTQLERDTTKSRI